MSREDIGEHFNFSKATCIGKGACNTLHKAGEGGDFPEKDLYPRADPNAAAYACRRGYRDGPDRCGGRRRGGTDARFGGVPAAAA